MSDFDAPTSTALNAGYASPFNVRNRIVGGIQARLTLASARVVWDACRDYEYLTRYSGGESGGLGAACGPSLTAIGFEAAIIGFSYWSVTGGALPNGMSLNASTATLEGTPTATGDFDFVVHGAGPLGYAERTFRITVLPPLQIDNLADFISYAVSIALSTGYSGDGIMLPTTGTNGGGNQFGISGVGYVTRACPDNDANPYLIFEHEGNSSGSNRINLVVTSTGIVERYDKAGPDFSLPGTYLKVGASGWPATLVLSEL